MSSADDVRNQTNARLWSRSGLVGKYASRSLRPPEVLVLARHREALSGRVLEIGCGAGRLTGYLRQLASSVVAIDVMEAMLVTLQGAYPTVTTEQRDVRDLDAYADRSFDAVVAGFSVLDVLSHEERRGALGQIRRILTVDGLLVFSTHNRAAAATITDALSPRGKSPRRALKILVRAPLDRRNRRRRLPLEVRELDYAILNDASHDWQALHYYITRDAQERQLQTAGFELIEVLDLDGERVPAGAAAPRSTELHYVARPLRS